MREGRSGEGGACWLRRATTWAGRSNIDDGNGIVVAGCEIESSWGLIF